MENYKSWFWILAWFITVVPMVGNGLVIFLIITKRHLHKKPNWFILSLAVADLFVALTYIPPLHACRNAPCSNEAWFVRQTIQWLFLYASVTKLFVLTVDRYIALTSPLKHKRCMTPTCIALSVITAWCVPIITRVCIFTPVYQSSKATALKCLVPVFLVMFEFVPCIVLPCLTFSMVYIVRKARSSRVMGDTSRDLESPIMRVHFRHESSRNHNIGVVVCVVGWFIVCYSVDVYTSVCNVFKLSSVSWQLWYARHLLLVANSALNPLAYALFKKDIKRAILALAGGRFQLVNNQVRPSNAN